MDKFYIKDEKIYVENEVELIELTLDELIDAINVLARKEVVMENALELACQDIWEKSSFSPTADFLKENYKHISADALGLIKHDEDAKLEEMKNG